MDFVVSKVAMSVTAILVAAILAGALDERRFMDQDGEIARVLGEFTSLIEDINGANAEADLAWSVPMMPTGAELRIAVDGNLIIGESGGFRAVARPMCAFHTWLPTTVCLNGSIVDDLDRSAPVLEAVSGQVIRIVVAELVVDSAEELMVFVLCAHQEPAENLSAKSLTASVNTSTSSLVL